MKETKNNSVLKIVVGVFVVALVISWISDFEERRDEEIREQAYSDFMDEHYDEIYSAGYDKGYKEGYSLGYDEGYYDCEEGKLYIN